MLEPPLLRYLGSAYVDYGLGSFAFYNTPPPTDQSGSLVITATGRHIDSVTWRPALIEDELPVPLSGAAATAALQNWTNARTCTDLTPGAGASVASVVTETSPPRPRSYSSSPRTPDARPSDARVVE